MRTASRAWRWGVVALTLTLAAMLATSSLPTAVASGSISGTHGPQTIAFVRFTAQSGHPRIYTVRPNGAAPKPVHLPVVAADEPTWSPDGRTLAFIAGLNAPNENHVTAPDDLYLARADGSGKRRLTHDVAHDTDPAWSPDGRWIAFVRSSQARANGSWIVVVGADGRHRHRLTYGGVDVEPSWAPSGRSIVFLRIDPKTYQSGIWVVRTNGSGLHRILGKLRGVTDPVWSPDGSWLLLTDSRTLFAVRPDGGSRRMLARLSADVKGVREDPRPTWSPDGKSVVFCQFRPGTVGHSDLWIVGADGNGLRRLTQSPGLDTDPTWGH